MEKLLICLSVNESAGALLDYGLKFADDFDLHYEVILIKKMEAVENIEMFLDGTPILNSRDKDSMKLNKDKEDEIISQLQARISPTAHLSIMGYWDDLIDILQDRFVRREFSILLLPHSANLWSWPFKDSLAQFVEKINSPILLVDPTVQYSRPEHVVYASDYIYSDVNVLKRFKKISANKVTDIDIIHISPGESFKEMLLEKGFQAYLKENIPDMNINVHHVSSLRTQPTIIDLFLEEVSRIAPDMLVLMKEEKSFIEEFFSTSFTITTAKRSSIPMLILHQRYTQKVED
ncbi:MAG: hypothetical protein ACRC6R_05640 [Bacteroidales bacterium]